MANKLDERLQLLEDRRQIEELRATYCFLVDDGRFEELANDCFTEDAGCDFRAVRGGTLSLVAKGHDEVRAFFTEIVPAALRDMCHMTHNHRIAIDGDRASGDCYFEVTGRDPATGEAIVGAGRYVDRYRRVGERWRFEQRNAEIFYMSPLAEGWVKQPFARRPDAPAAVRR